VRLFFLFSDFNVNFSIFISSSLFAFLFRQDKEMLVAFEQQVDEFVGAPRIIGFGFSANKTDFDVTLSKVKQTSPILHLIYFIFTFYFYCFILFLFYFLTNLIGHREIKMFIVIRS
jgi:hypothetical protein